MATAKVSTWHGTDNSVLCYLWAQQIITKNSGPDILVSMVASHHRLNRKRHSVRYQLGTMFLRWRGTVNYRADTKINTAKKKLKAFWHFGDNLHLWKFPAIGSYPSMQSSYACYSCWAWRIQGGGTPRSSHAHEQCVHVLSCFQLMPTCSRTMATNSDLPPRKQQRISDFFHCVLFGKALSWQSLGILVSRPLTNWYPASQRENTSLLLLSHISAGACANKIVSLA